MSTILVIGGGITGLSTMYYIQQALHSSDSEAEVNLILVEAGERLGGKIRTVQQEGFVLETGADSIVARKANMAPFLESLGLSEQVVYNATGISYLYRDGELKKIPEDAVFGIPTSVESLAASELVSDEGKSAALKDLTTPNDKYTLRHSLGEFLTEFLGEELVQKQIAPVISGVYSGELNDLTIESTFPYLLDYKNKYGSIILGLQAHKQQYLGNGSKKFISFDSGMSTLIDTLEQQLDQVDIRKESKAVALTKLDNQYRVTLENGDEIEADVVVLSTLHTTAQQLLENAELAIAFDELSNRSMISVYVGFDISDDELPLEGTGFIVSQDSELTCNACTWTSRKWAHTSKQQRLLVRLFYKSSSPHYESLNELSIEQLQQVAMKDVEKSLGLTGKPVVCEVTKWHDSMPNYHLQHPGIVRALEDKLEQHYPNIMLAGCSYYGVGIPDCIANGELTAQKIVQKLGL